MNLTLSFDLLKIYLFKWVTKDNLVLLFFSFPEIGFHILCDVSKPIFWEKKKCMKWYFSDKVSLHEMSNLFPEKTVSFNSHEISNALFSGKNKKNDSKCYLKFLPIFNLTWR